MRVRPQTPAVRPTGRMGSGTARLARAPFEIELAASPSSALRAPSPIKGEGDRAERSQPGSHLEGEERGGPAKQKGRPRGTALENLQTPKLTLRQLPRLPRRARARGRSRGPWHRRRGRPARSP